MYGHDHFYFIALRTLRRQIQIHDEYTFILYEEMCTLLAPETIRRDRMYLSRTTIFCFLVFSHSLLVRLCVCE